MDGYSAIGKVIGPAAKTLIRFSFINKKLISKRLKRGDKRYGYPILESDQI